MVMNAVMAKIQFLYSGPLGNVKNARLGFELIMHCSCHTYHSSICYSLRSQLCIWRLLKTILIRSMRSHHAMQTTTPWGKSFLLTWQEKKRKYYSLWRILVNLSNHNADGNGDVKEAIGLITKRTTLHVHRAFFVHFSLLDWNVKRSNGTYCRGRKHRINFLFVLFSYFDVLPKNSTSGNLTLIWPITCKPVEITLKN